MRLLDNDHPVIDALPATNGVSTMRAPRASTCSAGSRAIQRRCLDQEAWRESTFTARLLAGLRRRNAAAAAERRMRRQG
jgi:hypothetical protein